MNTLTIRTRTAMSESEKYSFDSRCRTIGVQTSPRVRRYEFNGPLHVIEDAAADIREHFGATVQVAGDDYDD